MLTYIWNPDRGQYAVSLPGLATGLSIPATFGTPNAPAIGSAFVGISNFSASSDPGAANDASQGYQPGSVWLNTAAGTLRTWLCRDATVGAARWVYEGSDFANGGTNPVTNMSQGGGAVTASIASEGPIYREVLSVTNGRRPGTTGSGALTVLGLYQVPASFFDGAVYPNGTLTSNRGLRIKASGSLGLGGNTRRMEIQINPSTATLGGTVGAGGFVVADSGQITAGGSGWTLEAAIFKYGAAGSNTQLGMMERGQASGTLLTLVNPQTLTCPENAAITIAVVAACTTAVDDVVFNFLEVKGLN